MLLFVHSSNKKTLSKHFIIIIIIIINFVKTFYFYYYYYYYQLNKVKFLFMNYVILYLNFVESLDKNFFKLIASKTHN